MSDDKIRKLPIIPIGEMRDEDIAAFREALRTGKPVAYFPTEEHDQADEAIRRIFEEENDAS